jgi:type I restriction enzyme M protein
MPDQLFYNTGIFTYLWILTNRKEKHHKGKIQLIDATSFYQKMRKSLGNKRNEISELHRHEITRLYGDFKEGEYVRIFDNADFGYNRITVERPLKLNFCVDDVRIERLKEANAFANLATSKKRKDTKAAQAEIEEGKQFQGEIMAALNTLRPCGLVKNRDEFEEMVKAAFHKGGIKVPASVSKAIMTALSERDETAAVCMADGKPEGDPELRDYENVPLKDDIGEYMKREVLPHVPDAWMDESKTKVGYEININRYFYKYTPPRPLYEIETDLKQIEKEIAEMLIEVTE